MQCPSCSGDLSPSDRFCRSCGAPIASPSEAPTYRPEAPPPPVPAAGGAPIDAPVGRVISSGSVPVGGFTPGAVLADRYRIIGLLGRGGMGEVYRADDLKLGQAVALKFLPKSLADDPVRRERFYAEVRIARQVSHPNICRVYDIGELAGPGPSERGESKGRAFLTMEYVDGEDLASLLKRIGRLPGDKAIDVARQLCAGLAAAHDKGVLHRDLKPANVMLDGRGRVRITDFGLAMAAGEDVAAGEVSGTPAYMAPEQFSGQGASVRSDIYALGLILYELYTGRRAFDGETLAELRAKKESATPTAPSEIARDIDPIVDRLIGRCLEKDPRHRPASVAQVAAALPGGDPLAAAIAAGETPSPEMVAASGSTEGLRPWVAWTCLAAVILGITAFAFLSERAQLFLRVPMEKPPEVLAERARQVLAGIGYTGSPAASAFGFEADYDYFQYMRAHDGSTSRWNRLADSSVTFWYRQFPRPMARTLFLPNEWFLPGVTSSDPPLGFSGDSLVRLDRRGRLLQLEVIPPQVDESSGASQACDWSVLFSEAGLDPTRWAAVEPTWNALLYADTRIAWREADPARPDAATRIEAGSYRGKPVYWRVIEPWRRPTRMVPFSRSPGQRAGMALTLTILASLIVGGAFLARRNLRMGRGDRRGATRIASFVFVLLAVVWVAGETHVPTSQEVLLVVMFVSWALCVSGFLWLLYVALEPFVRRRWPGSLVSWSRLLAGDVRDPLVGRDVLVGCVLGLAGDVLVFLTYPVASWLGVPQAQPSVGPPQVFLGIRWIVALAPWCVVGSLFIALAMLLILFLLRLLLRSEWAAAVMLVAILTAGDSLVSDSPVLIGIANALAYGATVFVLARYGFLAVVVSMLVAVTLSWFPITTDLAAWYSGIGIAGVVLLLGLTTYAFYTSLGGRPLFGRLSIEE